MIKVNAAQRLKAVDVIPRAYTDWDGDHDLKRLQRLFQVKRRKIGTDKNGISFWWLGANQALACTDNLKVVGFIGLRKEDSVEYKGTDIPIRQVSAVYLLPSYRGRGLILGMHQYLITQFNLLSDEIYTPDGIKVWRQLKRAGHKVEVIDLMKEGSKDWEDPQTLLLVRRNQ